MMTILKSSFQTLMRMISGGNVKRFLVDAAGNYVFFVPVVLAFNAWTWPIEAIMSYLISSILICGFGRPYSLFLKHIWYPLWREEF